MTCLWRHNHCKVTWVPLDSCCCSTVNRCVFVVQLKPISQRSAGRSQTSFLGLHVCQWSDPVSQDTLLIQVLTYHTIMCVAVHCHHPQWVPQISVDISHYYVCGCTLSPPAMAASNISWRILIKTSKPHFTNMYTPWDRQLHSLFYLILKVYTKYTRKERNQRFVIIILKSMSWRWALVEAVTGT